MSERLPWDNRGVSDERRNQLLKDRVLELTLPPHNMKRKEIAKYVNRSESKVWKVQRKLIDEGKLQARLSGHIIKEKPARDLKQYEEITHTQFVKIASVNRWVTNMRNNKVKNIPYYVTNFYKVCKTLDVTPDAFLGEPEMIEELHQEFIRLFREGKVVYITKKKHDLIKQSQANPKHYTKAIKSFRKGNLKETPSEILKIAEDNITIYARLQLADEEKRIGINFFNKFDQELGDIFILHHEFGPRINALLTMKPIFEKKTTLVDGLECEYYLCTVLEEKQEDRYEKIVITPEAREVVKRLVNGKPIHSKTNLKELKGIYNQKLKEYYALIGKISSDPIVQKNYELKTHEWYYVNDATHVIRHSCVHWLMRMTGYRKDVVANMFWDTPDTLKIYNQVSMEELLQYNVCNYCNPPKYYKNLTFCNINHAIRYYNLPEVKKTENQNGQA